MVAAVGLYVYAPWLDCELRPDRGCGLFGLGFGGDLGVVASYGVVVLLTFTALSLWFLGQDPG